MAKLPKAVSDEVDEKVDELFDRLKLRYLGPQSVDKSLFISWDFSKEYLKQLSLPGIYEAAVADEGGLPNLETYFGIMETAGNYIDATRERAKASVKTKLAAFMNEKGPSKDYKQLIVALEGALSETWAKVGYEVQRIIDSEATTARNIGFAEGIERVAASQGIDDPTVFFVVVRDNIRCNECTRLHLLEDKITPRVWKMSELSHDYHKKGDPVPSIHGLHPHCRCSITVLMPGFGFDASGKVTWIKEGWDEFAEQRKVTKSEPYTQHDCELHKAESWQRVVEQALQGKD